MWRARRAAAAAPVLPAGRDVGALILRSFFNGPWFCSHRHCQGETDQPRLDTAVMISSLWFFGGPDLFRAEMIHSVCRRIPLWRHKRRVWLYNILYTQSIFDLYSHRKCVLSIFIYFICLSISPTFTVNEHPDTREHFCFSLNIRWSKEVTQMFYFSFPELSTTSWVCVRQPCLQNLFFTQIPIKKKNHS